MTLKNSHWIPILKEISTALRNTGMLPSLAALFNNLEGLGSVWRLGHFFLPASKFQGASESGKFGCMMGVERS